MTWIVAGHPTVLLLCGTGFIGYLPVPILTAIVISALLGATEFDLAARLWEVSRTEFFIFVGAFVGVLLLGTINGVLIGMILPFSEMIIRTSKPARCLGIPAKVQAFPGSDGDRPDPCCFRCLDLPL